MESQIIHKGGDDWEIRTDAPIEAINEVAIYLHLLWIQFASGQLSFPGGKIEHPTGAYFASIKMQKDGLSGIKIYADTSSEETKHGEYLSVGHAAYDMKNDIFMGKSWPMHRLARVYTGHSPKVPQSKKGDLGWIIPPMKGMFPAKHLADLAKNSLDRAYPA